MGSTRFSKFTRATALVVGSLVVGALAMWLVAGRPRLWTPVAVPAAARPAGGAATDALPAVAADAGGDGVYISPERQQLIGVRTAPVSRQMLDRTVRTVGVIAYDETRSAEIHTKIAGWVEDVSADFVGKPIRKGQALFRIYSPDLVATQREYLLALKADRQLSASQVPETREGARALLEATRQRLRLWDVTDAQIATLTETGEPQRTLAVYSPASGIILERTVFPGQYITPELPAFKIADLSTLWVIGQMFEYELGAIRLGQSVTVEFPYGQTTRAVKGRITFIYPDIDPQTRRARVRVELPNPGLDLKPGSFVTVVVSAGGGEQLVVPQEAVIDTGAEQYVLLALPGGYFEPRRVKVGSAAGQVYPVLDGLKTGDLVVTSAQFLIDSESNLQAAMQSMAGHGHAGGGESKTPPPSAAPSAATPAVTLAIALKSTPDPARLGVNQFDVTVRDAQGQPVSDATVAVTFFMAAMPTMGMPAIRAAAALAAAGDGVYRGSADLGMAGRWDVTVTVSRAGQRIGRAQFGQMVR